MTLTSDIVLSHPLWERVDNELCNKESIGLFSRMVDVYVVAAAIGIREDKAVNDIEIPLDPPKSIGRNTYQSQLNTDLFDVLEFMLQNAVINTKTLSISNDERLKLAFDPDYYIDKLRPAEFLTGFANYGIQEIFDKIDSSASLVAISDLYQYFNELTESSLDDLLAEITLDFD